MTTEEALAWLQQHLASAPVRTTPDGYTYREALPWVKLQDGTQVSVQVGSGIYSTPRNYVGPWTEVELGFPTKTPPDYIQEHEDAGYGVYPYTPIELVARWFAEVGIEGTISHAERQGGKKE